jgi:hypothetical protein
MADEEKRWYLENPTSDIIVFQQKSFHLLCDEADFNFTTEQ